MLKRLLTFLGWLGWAELIYGSGRRGERTLYLARLPLTPMTRWGQLLWHVFYRGDEDPDPHDHPWDFWTMPLGQGYYEEVMEHDGTIRLNRVRAWHWHFRSWAYTHRVLYPEHSDGGFGRLVDSHSGIQAPYRGTNACWPLFTLVFRRNYNGRPWGFWVKSNNPVLEHIGWNIQSNPCTSMRDTNHLSDRWRMKVPWRTYLYGEEQKDPL